MDKGTALTFRLQEAEYEEIRVSWVSGNLVKSASARRTMICEFKSTHANHVASLTDTGPREKVSKSSERSGRRSWSVRSEDATVDGVDNQMVDHGVGPGRGRS